MPFGMPPQLVGIVTKSSTMSIFTIPIPSSNQFHSTFLPYHFIPPPIPSLSPHPEKNHFYNHFTTPISARLSTASSIFHHTILPKYPVLHFHLPHHPSRPLKWPSLSHLHHLIGVIIAFSQSITNQHLIESHIKNPGHYQLMLHQPTIE